MSARFHSLTISEVRRETSDAISISFIVPGDLKPAFMFRAGQHLTLRTTIEGEEVRRSYSLCTAPEDGDLRVAIKRVSRGCFSNWANTHLAVGQALDVMAPTGSFTWDFNGRTARHYVGFAGGSGITPVLSLLKTALATELDSHFSLFYGNRDVNSILFLSELSALEARYSGRLHIYHVLEEHTDQLAARTGRLDSRQCALLLDLLMPIEQIEAFFICGPEPMMDAAEGALIERGITRHRILIERFTSATTQPALDTSLSAGAGSSLTVTLDGKTHVIPYDPARGSILESALAAGLPAPYACKAGVCSTCRALVVSGKVNMASNDGLQEDELAAGYTLACQAIPITNPVVIDFDR